MSPQTRPNYHMNVKILSLKRWVMPESVTFGIRICSPRVRVRGAVTLSWLDVRGLLPGLSTNQRPGASLSSNERPGAFTTVISHLLDSSNGPPPLTTHRPCLASTWGRARGGCNHRLRAEPIIFVDSAFLLLMQNFPCFDISNVATC